MGEPRRSEGRDCGGLHHRVAHHGALHSAGPVFRNDPWAQAPGCDSAAVKIFVFQVQEGFEWVLPADEGDFELFRALDGSSQAATWKPIHGW